MKSFILLFAFILVLSPFLCAQIVSDSTVMQKKWNMTHSPLKATVFAAALPGAGQVYNHKYWKLPILYAGIGTCVYFIVDNTKIYRAYRDAYVASADGDPNTVPAIDLTSYNLDATQEIYHKYMDISYMSLVGVYVLQIIDANVDAHLFYYDVTPNLGLSVLPTAVSTGHITPGISIGFHF